MHNSWQEITWNLHILSRLGLSGGLGFLVGIVALELLGW